MVPSNSIAFLYVVEASPRFVVDQADLKITAEDFFQFLLTLMAVAYTFNGLGHLLAALTPNAQVAGIMGGMIVTLCNLFSGFFIVSAFLIVLFLICMSTPH